MRLGDAPTTSGTLDLLTAGRAKRLSGVRLRIIHEGKGFYVHTLVEQLEARRARFVSVAHLTGPIKLKLTYLRYVSLSRGIEVSEFRYQPIRWHHPYRFVIGCRTQPEETREQLTLFNLGRYHYQVLVMNLPLQPLNSWRLYNDRAEGEWLIKQLKGGYALGAIPTWHFFANETYFHLLLLAQNLINWFKRLCLPPEFQNATLQTLHHQILFMSAQPWCTDNRPRFVLLSISLRGATWKYALGQIERLEL